jgi:hypothetical protein
MISVPPWARVPVYHQDGAIGERIALRADQMGVPRQRTIGQPNLLGVNDGAAKDQQDR